MAAHVGEAVHLLGGRLGTPDHRQAERDEPARVLAAPLVDVPVVVRPHHRGRDLVVLGGSEDAAREPRHRGEAQRTEEATGVHVLDALVDIPTAFAHLVEAGRLDAVLLPRPACDGVQPDVGDLVLVVVPGQRAVLPLLELRGELLVLGGQVPLEHVRGLDDVVVDAHQDQVVLVHQFPLGRCGWSQMAEPILMECTLSTGAVVEFDGIDRALAVLGPIGASSTTSCSSSRAQRVRAGEAEQLGARVEPARSAPPRRLDRAVLDEDAGVDEVAQRSVRRLQRDRELGGDRRAR